MARLGPPKQTLKTMADRANVDDVALSLIESGKRIPRPETIARLARGYGLPEDELAQLAERDAQDRELARLSRNQPAVASAVPPAVEHGVAREVAPVPETPRSRILSSIQGLRDETLAKLEDRFSAVIAEGHQYQAGSSPREPRRVSHARE